MTACEPRVYIRFFKNSAHQFIGTESIEANRNNNKKEEGKVKQKWLIRQKRSIECSRIKRKHAGRQTNRKRFPAFRANSFSPPSHRMPSTLPTSE